MDSLIDFHMHTFFSDGELLPSELHRRAVAAGYTALAMCDHADDSNITTLLAHYGLFIKALDRSADKHIIVLPGVELTHVLPCLIASNVELSRSSGAKIVGCHGETIVEPVAAGTNRAAIEAGVDFLAHPGLISEDDVRLAAQKGVYLELTTRRGHSLTNGHVARLAKKYGAKLIVNTDTHSPDNLLSREIRKKIILGAGLELQDVDIIIANSEELLKKAIERS
ncbi:MAG: histidinol phosphate phosphatase domain-containing protein [Candidatus Auribacterota bacterium]|jgi:histidinol phosphatase-like PHP family hydrolase|nr:histidinol phosphate phosphatase domain-containing protein [Candidatus Auribacterota bacterium]